MEKRKKNDQNQRKRKKNWLLKGILPAVSGILIAVMILSCRIPDGKTAVNESIRIPGYEEIQLSQEEPELCLVNPEENDVYLLYEIRHGETTLYESGPIGPGSSVAADLYEKMKRESGEHTVQFYISAYDEKSGAKCNGAAQDVKVILH